MIARILKARRNRRAVLRSLALIDTYGSTTPVCDDCSEEYGPCEAHCVRLAVREGASLHTGDELAALFLLDAADLGATVSSEDRALAERVTGWCADPDVVEAIQDAVLVAESSLPEGVQVFWEDGYTIVRMTDGPALA